MVMYYIVMTMLKNSGSAFVKAIEFFLIVVHACLDWSHRTVVVFSCHNHADAMYMSMVSNIQLVSNVIL